MLMILSLVITHFVRIFSKPEAHKGRRLAVALVFDRVEKALEKAHDLITKIKDA